MPRQVQAFQQRHVDILEAQYEAYLEEADHLLAFRNALCSFALHNEGKTKPTSEVCQEFKIVEKDIANEDNTVKKVNICKLGDTPIPDCALSETWKSFLKNPPKKNAGREFFKALTAYTRLFPVRAAQIEQDFNLIDLKHRENLASQEMSLKAWNNLAAVPIDQLDAYYQSSLKAEVIADLVVKALGFAAITVGVSK